jgi:hypothetical protein
LISKLIQGIREVSIDMVTDEEHEFIKILSLTQTEWGYLRGLREFRKTGGFTVELDGNTFFNKYVDSIGRISLGKEAFKGFKVGDCVRISVRGKSIKIAQMRE